MLKKIYTRFLLKSSKPQRSDDYTSCSDLPLLRFIKVITTGDLSHLGYAINPHELWANIHSEYVQLSGDQQSNRALDLLKQITTLTNRINITNQICAYLTQRNVPELIDVLANMGYRITRINLEQDLKIVLSLSKSDHVKLAFATEQYAKLPKGQVSENTELAWYKTLAVFAKFQGVSVINPALITVMDFCAIDRNFKEYNIQMEKAYNGR